MKPLPTSSAVLSPSVIAQPAHLCRYGSLLCDSLSLFHNEMLFGSRRSSTDRCTSIPSQPPGAGGGQRPVQQAVLPGLHVGQSPPEWGWGAESHGHPAGWECHPHPHHAACSLRPGRLRQVRNSSGCSTTRVLCKACVGALPLMVAGPCRKYIYWWIASNRVRKRSTAISRESNERGNYFFLSIMSLLFSSHFFAIYECVYCIYIYLSLI